MEGDLQRTVGRNLRALRETLGLSQEAFAEMVGVHRTYMGGLERGERNLTLKSLERIAARVDVEPLLLMQAEASVDTTWARDVTLAVTHGRKAAAGRRPHS